MKFQLLYLFIAAALIRFIAINQSLWLDEAIVANVTKNLGVVQILSQFSPTDFHPPLYYLFMKGWTLLFGSSELALRLPSVLFSLLAGYFVYLTGKKLISKDAGFWAAAFFLINPLVVYFSQEARMYSMVTMWVAMAVYYLARLWKDHAWHEGSEHASRKQESKEKQAKLQKAYWTDIAVLNLVLGISFVTFYGAVFFILAVYLLLLAQKQYKSFLLLTPGPVLALAAVSPLLVQQLAHSKVALSDVKNWSAVLGTPNLKNLLLIPMKFVLGKISFEPKALYYGLALISVAIVGFFAVKGGQKLKKLGFLLIAPLVIAFVFSFTTPLLQYFRFLYLIPLLALLLAYGTRNAIAARSVILGIFLISTAAYLFTPAFQREDWKHSLIGVTETLPVYIIHSVSDPLQYYYPTYTRKDLKAIEQNPVTEDAIIVIPYAADIHGFPYVDVLTRQGLRRVDQVAYNGVMVEFWERDKQEQRPE